MLGGLDAWPAPFLPNRLPAARTLIAMSKPKILVARAIFPETLERLSAHFEVDANQADVLFTPE